VVFLDAELYRDRVGTPAIVESLETEKEICPAWCVYVSHATPAARWIECECHAPFAAFVRDELMPWLEKLHPEIRACDERVLAGLSYTGLATSFVAKHAGSMFSTVISQSGSYWWDDCRLVRNFAALQSPLPVRFHLDVGRRETQENVQHKEDVLQVISQIEGVRRFRDALLATGHEVNYHEFEGGHDFACWKETLPLALRWALGKRARN
jgi:enterochelin esterase family protein